MKRIARGAVYAILACTAAGCYHQVVQTGLTPSSTVVEKSFVSTWLWGLVPSSEVDTRSMCPSGAAVIETQQSFLNGVVGILTLGIYTPQDVTITCATGTAMLPTQHLEMTVSRDATTEDRAAALAEAVDEARASGEPVVLRY